MSRKRKFIILSTAFLVLLVTVGILLFWPDEPSESQPPPPVKAKFLDFESPWADSLTASLSEEECWNQLFFLSFNAADSLSASIGQFPALGGSILRFRSGDFVDSLHRSQVPQFLAAPFPQALLMGSDAPNYPAILALSEPRQRLIDSLYRSECSFLGINAEMFPLVEGTLSNDFPEIDTAALALSAPKVDSLHRTFHFQGLLGKGISDSVNWSDDLFDPFIQTDEALPGLIFRPAVYLLDKEPLPLNEILREQDLFNGLLVGVASTVEEMHLAFENGADMIYWQGDQHSFRAASASVRSKLSYSKDVLKEKARKVLLAKAWSGLDEAPPRDTLTAPDELRSWLASSIRRNSLLAVSNRNNAIPMMLDDRSRVIIAGIGQRPSNAEVRSAYRHHPVSAQSLSWEQVASSSASYILVTIDSSVFQDTVFKRYKERLTGQKNLIALYQGPLDSLHQLDGFATLLATPDRSETAGNMLVDAAFGALPIQGGFPRAVRNLSSFKTERIQMHRLGYADALSVGIHPDSLRKIDYIAREAINAGAFPGCQVLVAKNGQIIYEKSFGHLDYSRTKAVDEETLYDLASVTKVTAATMMAMHLYDQGKYQLDDRLASYLPDSIFTSLGRKSTLESITFRELLTHRSGLPAGMNINPYRDYINEEVGRFDRFYCDMPDDTMFCMEVAKEFYLEESYMDSIWLGLNSVWLDANKEYRYSDLSMVLMYMFMRSWLEEDFRKENPRYENPRKWDPVFFEEELQETFYRPLNMDRTVYLPLRYFDEEVIAPTERDTWWRRQTLRGHVHDPTAALLGGVSGNAGLFSTSRDLATLCQMLIFGGSYGGRTYLKEETVELFTQRQPEGHRGLGWNKPVGGGLYGIPEKASMRTYGHTGYTGNSLWVDPDNEIVFILLSNRSHPVGNNPKMISLGVQRRMHEAIYSGLLPWHGL